MYSYLLLCGIALVAAFFLERRYPRILTADRGLLGIIFLLCGLCLGRLSGGIVFELAPVSFQLESSRTLVALRTTYNTTGTFVLASGAINRGMTYDVQVLNEDGSTTPGRLPAEPNVTILQDPGLLDQGTWKTYRKTVDKTWWLSGFAIAPDRQSDFRHELHVPPGSIVKEISFP